MPISRKVAISLLITAISLFVFTLMAFTGLFNLVEMRFYDPAVLKSVNQELSADTTIIDQYLQELEKRFSDTLGEAAVRRSFLLDQESADIYERSRIFGLLTTSIQGLQYVRFIDGNGTRIHYSTNFNDQILQHGDQAAYKSYNEVQGYVPFDQALLSGINTTRILFDEVGQRLVFYFPFYDNLDIYRGEALFSLSIRAFSNRLLAASRIKVSDDVSVIADPKGIVIGLPEKEQNNPVIQNTIASLWKTGSLSISIIDSPSLDSLVLLSKKTSQDIFVGRLVDERIFGFSGMLKGILLFCFFLTVFILIFLIFNVRQDPVAVVQNRLKELQVNLLKEYYQIKGAIDWEVWRHELEQRRDDVKQELRRGIKIEAGSDIDIYINSFFEKSWDDLLAAVSGNTAALAENESAASEDKKQTEVIKAESEKPEIGELEEIEELEDISEADAEDFDKIETLSSIDEVEDVEDIKAAADAESPDAEPLEEIEEDEDEIEEIEEISEAESVESTPAPLKKSPEKQRTQPHRLSNPKLINLFNPDLSDADLDVAITVEPWFPTGITGLIGADALKPEELAALPDDIDAWDIIAEDAAELEDNFDVFESVEEAVPVQDTSPDTVGTLLEVAPDEAAEDIAEALPVDMSEVDKAKPPLLSVLERDPFVENITEFDLPEEPPAIYVDESGEISGDLGFVLPQLSEDEQPSETIATDDTIDSYDVEEFESVSDEEFNNAPKAPKKSGPSFTFESPHKGTDFNALARKIEFAPVKENQKDEEELEMDIAIDSPMDGIFFAKAGEVAPVISRVAKDEAAPVQEAEKPQPVSFQSKEPVTRAVESSFTYRPFWGQSAGEFEYLEDADAESEEIMEMRDGVTYIDSAALSKAELDNSKIDQNMKNLVDSVLGKTG